MTQQIWIPKNDIPSHERPNTKDSCVEITIRKNCEHCNNSMIPRVAFPGSKDSPTVFTSVCIHYKTYLQIWANRIIGVGVPVIGNIQPIKYPITYITKTKSGWLIGDNKQTDPTKDGMRCSGSCGSWHPMVIANRDDGSFICYGCRTGF